MNYIKGYKYYRLYSYRLNNFSLLHITRNLFFIIEINFILKGNNHN